MHYFPRLLFCSAVWLAIPVLPWPVLFGAIVFAAASWSWFFEATILGLIIDAVSGLPLGFHALLFTAFIIFIEGTRSYLRSDARLEMIWVAAIAAVEFGISELVFWEALLGRQVALSAIFYRDLFMNWLTLGITVAALIGARILLRQMNHVWEEKIFQE